MLQIMKQTARAAGKIQMEYFRQAELDVSRKTDHQNILTIADKKSQDCIQQLIVEELGKQGIPSTEIGFIGEEDLQADGSHVFVIDPIDGTSNFACGIDYFCTSIGYFYKGDLQAGVILRPAADELYFAKKGKGAFAELGMINQKLEMKGLPSSELMLTFNLGNTLTEEAHLPIAAKLISQFRGGRSLGAVALDVAKCAAGEIGMTVDTGPYIWDYAAALCILREAGGVAFDFNGEDITLDLSDRHKKYDVITCHPSLKEQAMQAVC